MYYTTFADADNTFYEGDEFYLIPNVTIGTTVKPAATTTAGTVVTGDNNSTLTFKGFYSYEQNAAAQTYTFKNDGTLRYYPNAYMLYGFRCYIVDSADPPDNGLGDDKRCECRRSDFTLQVG